MVLDQVLRFLFLCVSICSVLTQDSSYFRFLPTSTQQQQQQPQPVPPSQQQQPQYYGYPGGYPTLPQVPQGSLGYPGFFGGSFPQQYGPPTAYNQQQFYPEFNAPAPFFPFQPAFNPQEYYQTYSNVLGNSTPTLTAVNTSVDLNGTSPAVQIAQPAIITTVTNTTGPEVNVSTLPGLAPPVFGQPFFPGGPGFAPPQQPFYPPLPYSPVFNHQEFYRSFSNVLGSIIPNQTTFITGANVTDNSTIVNATHDSANTPVLLGGDIPASETHAARQGPTRTVLVDRFPNYSMYFRRPTQNAGVDFGRPINYQFVYSSQLRDMNDILQSGRSPTSNTLPIIPGLPTQPPVGAVPHPAAGIPAVAVHPPAAGVHPPAVAVHPPAPGIHPPAVGVHPPAAAEHPPAAAEHPPAAGVQPSAAAAHPPSAAVQSPPAAVPSPAVPIQQPPLAFPPPAFPSQPYPFGFHPYAFGPQFPPFGYQPSGFVPPLPAIAPQTPAAVPHLPAVSSQLPAVAPQLPAIVPHPPATAVQPPAVAAQPAAEVTVKPLETDEKKPIIAASSVVVVRKVVKNPNFAAGKITTTPAISAADKSADDDSSLKVTTPSSKDATSSSS